jgi:hypothetical protein
MCGFHDFPDGNFFRRARPPSAALIARTRLVEKSMAGDSVPDDAWETFFTPVCGAIDLRHFERMFKSRQTALAFLFMQSKARPSLREKPKFVCATDDL